MVTIDQKVSNVGKFKGDLQAGRRDYERAKQGIELLENYMSRFEDALKIKTGFNKLNLPSEPTTTPVEIGDVKFFINSRRRTKRPKYKEAVVGMENYLSGISFLLSEGRTITGIVKEGRSTYIRADRLLEAYELIVAGVIEPEVIHDISYDVKGKLVGEPLLDEIVLGDLEEAEELSEANAISYVRGDRIKPNLVNYVNAYEKALTKGQRKPKKTTEVTTRSAYTTTKGKSEGPDWAYVVKTLVTVPTEKEVIGELNILADESVSKAEKERRFPWYKLDYKEPWGTKKLYVSIETVYQRIQALKESKSVEADRLKVEPKEVV